MKSAIVILLYTLLLFASCKGQQPLNAKAYTQKNEYGLKGAVKEVKTYICKVLNDVIPTDTVNCYSKYSITFNQAGDMLENNRNLHSNGKTISSKMIFSGTGRNITYQEITNIDDEDADTSEYQYQWTDSLNYKIVNKSKPHLVQQITLNRDFNIIKSLFHQGATGYVTEYKNVYSNGQLQKVEQQTIQTGKQKAPRQTHIQLMKAYDEQGNPTVIYGYDKATANKPVSVAFKKYTYYPY